MKADKQEYIGSEYNPQYDEEKAEQWKPRKKGERKQIRKFHDDKLPEETPVKTRTGIISIPKNSDKINKLKQL